MQRRGSGVGAVYREVSRTRSAAARPNHLQTLASYVGELLNIVIRTNEILRYMRRPVAHVLYCNNVAFLQKHRTCVNGQTEDIRYVEIAHEATPGVACPLVCSFYLEEPRFCQVLVQEVRLG